MEQDSYPQPIFIAFNPQRVNYLEKPPSTGKAAMPNKTINHVNMQKLASFVILLVMSPVLLVLVALFGTRYLSTLLAISGFLG